VKSLASEFNRMADEVAKAKIDVRHTMSFMISSHKMTNPLFDEI
jgi:hypothetical protein